MDHHARRPPRPGPTPSSTPAGSPPWARRHGLSRRQPRAHPGPLAPTITGTAPAPGGAATGTAPAQGRRRPTPAPPAVGRSAAVAAGQVPNCTPVSLAQRAARTLIVGIPDVTDPSDPIVKKVLDIGVGGIFLNPGNVESESQLMRLVQGIRAQAGRPIVITVDEEPGRVSSLGDILGPSPSARRMADEGPASEVRTYAHEVAIELARLGIDLNLAPVADLTDGPYDGIIGDRSFSADPAIASEYALAFAEGMADGGVRSAAKHFPGQGRSTDDIHFEAAAPITTPLDILRLTDVRPFRDLVRAGIPVVMMNHIRYTALDRNLPASLSPKAYALLRDLGFQGVAITDSLGMGAVNLTWGFYDAAPMAVAAGADGLLGTDGFFAEEMRDGLVDAVAAGRLSEAPAERGRGPHGGPGRRRPPHRRLRRRRPSPALAPAPPTPAVARRRRRTSRPPARRAAVPGRPEGDGRLPPPMSRRTSTTIGVAAAVLAAGLFGLTWRNMSTRDSSKVGHRSAGHAPRRTTTRPPPPPSTTAAPVIGPTREAEPGATLRLGYARPPSSPAMVADAIVPTVGLYNAPGDAEPADSLDNPTWEGLPGVYLVHAGVGRLARGPGPDAAQRVDGVDQQGRRLHPPDPVPHRGQPLRAPADRLRRGHAVPRHHGGRRHRQRAHPHRQLLRRRDGAGAATPPGPTGPTR